MARAKAVYHLIIDLSDIDGSKYESLDFRVAQHPSESLERLVARVLAYALLYEERLEFGKGVSDADEPSLWVHDLTGQLTHWVDVGVPTAERIHLASKKSRKVTIVCHKGQEALRREMSKKRVHNAEHIDVLYLEPTFVSALAPSLDRSCAWTLVVNDGQLSVTVGDQTHESSLVRSSLPVASA